MDKPPARFVKGGRFNRQGVSYLYLADNVETCISEIHLQVGQICSIVQFKCIKEGKYLFIENKSEEVLYGILDIIFKSSIAASIVSFPTLALESPF